MGYGGAPTMSPEKVRLRAKKNDFGNTVRTVRETFVLRSTRSANRSVAYGSILAFISKYSASYSLPLIPALDDLPEEWAPWLEQLHDM